MKIYTSSIGVAGYYPLPSVYVSYKIGGKWWQTTGVELQFLRYRIWFMFS